MKKNNKGISMISLVVVIISIIILSAVAGTAGYRYIVESRRAEMATLTSLISEAAYRRQNDYNVDGQSYYEGYVILKEEDITNTNFKNLPEDFESEKVKIAQELNGTSPVWFVLDGKSATQLGIEQIHRYDKYIIEDIEGITEEYSPVALVEYVTGSTYLVEMKGDFDLEIPADHEHLWITATCTDDSKCRICGEELPNTALGHDIMPQTCTQAEMCRRCGEIFKPALGHDYEGASWTTDALKHWYECKNGCGTKKDLADHTKNYITLDESHEQYDECHIENCYVCGWESAPTEHDLIIENDDDTHHRIYCTLCDYIEIHEDSGWQSDKNYHWKDCDECGNQILKGPHEDKDNDHNCDICGRQLDTTPPNSFDAGDIRIVKRTTHRIEISAKTEDDADGLGLEYYEFSIDGGTTWHKVEVSSDDETATFEFANLIHGTDFEVTVRATDKAGNSTVGTIAATTYLVPDEFVAHTQIPENAITNNNVTITLSLPTITTLPQVAINELKVVYKIDGVHTDWQDYTMPIIVEEEGTIIIYTKIVDTRVPEANSSSVVKTINVKNIDKTAPSVTIEATGTTISKTEHTATVRLTDNLAGIAKDTIIYYAWTTDENEPEGYSEYKLVETEGLETTVTIKTPTGVQGTYYLWIKEGVSDAVGNLTKEAVRSEMYFVVDDIKPQLIVRTMKNAEAGAIDEMYVKTAGTITVTIKSDKELSQGPLVTITTPGGNIEGRATSTDGINWTAKIQATETLTEGLLNNVKFSDYISDSGKPGDEYTTTTDDKYITFDKTIPALEYINK